MFNSSNTLRNAFELSAANTILDNYFSMGDNLSDIANSLNNTAFQTTLQECGTGLDDVIEELDRADIEDVTGYRDNAARLNHSIYRGNFMLRQGSVVGFLGEYEELRIAAAKVGLNSAGFMPRLVTGDIVGTPLLLRTAFDGLEKEIMNRIAMADTDFAKAVAWRIRGIIALSMSEEEANKKIIAEIRKLKSNEEPKLNEEYMVASSILVNKLCYNKEATHNLLIDLMGENPNWNAEEIVAYVLRNK